MRPAGSPQARPLHTFARHRARSIAAADTALTKDTSGYWLVAFRPPLVLTWARLHVARTHVLLASGGLRCCRRDIAIASILCLLWATLDMGLDLLGVTCVISLPPLGDVAYGSGPAWGDVRDFSASSW